MINFNSDGLITPYSNIELSIFDFKMQFVDNIQSNTRQLNFEKYLKYSQELKELLEVSSIKQWINGSFVTLTQNPKDIDLVSFIDFNLRQKYEIELKNFEALKSNELYGVDAYLLTVFPEDHTNYYLFKSDKSYWYDHFSKTRRNSKGIKNKKGFVEINY